MAGVFLEHLEPAFSAEVPELLSALRRVGLWRPAALSHLFRANDLAEVENTLRQLLGASDDDDIDYHVPYMLQAASAARREFASKHHDIIFNSTWELAAAAHARTLAEERAAFEGVFRSRQLQVAQSRVPPPTARLRSTVFARAVAAHEGDPHGREKAEADYRNRMLGKMEAMMMQVGLDASSVRLVAAGRRASTLDTRLRAWAAFQRWLVQAGGRSAPLSPQDFVDYLAARAEEPCGRGTLRGVMAMLGFLDDVYRRQGAERWSRDKSVLDAFSEYGSTLSARAGGMPITKALRPSV